MAVREPMLLYAATSTNGFKVSKADNFAHFTAPLPGYFLLFSNGEDGPHGQGLPTVALADVLEVQPVTEDV